MLVTPEELYVADGMVTDVSDEHPLNAFAPMVCKLVGKVTEVRLVQSANASSSMVTSDDGKVTEEYAVEANVACAMTVTGLPNSASGTAKAASDEPVGEEAGEGTDVKVNVSASVS